MIVLSDNLEFPNTSKANKYGVLAIGGDLSPERLLLAYKSGIFPWYNPGEIIQWWATDPRFILHPQQLRISKSTQKLLNNNHFQFTENKEFREVITSCAIIKRTEQNDSWITQEMIDAYCVLHEKGLARSLEVWKDSELVGGFYGIDLKSVFCGESMFSKVSNASKCGFTFFVQKYSSQYKIIDCQVYTEYLAQLGAIEISFKEYKDYLDSYTVKNLHFKQ